MNYTLLIVLITLICILVLAFLIKPVKNYIYKPQRYVEYIHPTMYRDTKFLDKVIINNRNDEHHGLSDLSLLDNRYIKDIIQLPNQAMIHIWFECFDNKLQLNHFYVDYYNNPPYWKFTLDEKDKSRYEFNLEDWEYVHFTPEIPKIERRNRFERCREGYYNDKYFISNTRRMKHDNSNHDIEYKFVFDNKNLNLLSYYYKQV